MPDASSRVFEVVCKGCGRSLVTVERVRDPEIAVLVAHLRVCAASEPLEDAFMLGEIMPRLSAKPVDHQMNAKVPLDQASVTATRGSR